MNAGAKTDVPKFMTALRAKVAASQRTLPEILNKAALNIAFRSASFTPKGSAAKVRADLMKDSRLRYALTAIALKKKGIGALKSPEFAKAVAKFVSRKASSVAYLRAAFAKAVQQLGGTFRGALFPKGADGFANKASMSKLLAEIVAITNQPDEKHAAGAERIGLKAVQEAINFVADDMLLYAQKKLQVALNT